MSTPSRYQKNKTHPSRYYASFPSPVQIGPTDPRYLYGSASDMGPPPLELPPQVLEIDPSSSTTLPSPHTSTAWNSPAFPLHAFGDVSTYGPASTARQTPLENYTRGTAQNPLCNWYNENDGPWIPKSTISELPEGKNPRPLQGSGLQFQNGHPYHQRISSDGGAYPFGVPPSDSGYGTRRSDGNASVFSVDIPDRDQDGQSLAGTAADFQQYPRMDEGLEQRDSHIHHWTVLPDATISDDQCGKRFICPRCPKEVKTKSELKKHILRHTKPFICDYPGCSRDVGFSTTNDLVRHKTSKHPHAVQRSEGTKRYRCPVEGCKSKEKSWPRLDNFRSHLKRVHKTDLANDDEIEAMVKRAEYMEPATSSISRCHDFVQSPSSSGLAQTTSMAHHSLPKPQKMTTKLKDLYLEDTETPHYSSESKKRPFDHLDKVGPVDELASTYESAPRDTIQASDILNLLGRGQDDQLTQGILSASVSLKDIQLKASDPGVHPSTPSARLSPQDKAEVCHASALDAITEVFKAALVGGSAPVKNNGLTSHQNPEWTLFDRKASPQRMCKPGSNSLVTSTGVDVNIGGSPALPESSIDLEARSKAIEVLKILQNFGYMVQGDPSHSIKPLNSGSVTSSKSENLVTCQLCGKFKGRPCELKKHMKRHSRPYACTFPQCTNKTFGSKNDWKRHENSQHHHLESWRCDKEKPDGSVCAKVCYEKQPFIDHLQKDHLISENIVASKVEACHIGRNCQERFWCGFCVKLIDLEQRTMGAWTERFDHIDHHFMGSHGFAKQSIQEWVAVYSSDRPKPTSRYEIPEDSSQSPDLKSSNASSPESTDQARPSSVDTATIIDAQGGSKRKHTDDDVNKRPRKQRSRASTGGSVVYCCQCQTSHNPKLDQNCSLCTDSHRFCDACVVEPCEVES